MSSGVVPGEGFLASPHLRALFAALEAELVTARDGIAAACAALDVALEAAL